MNRDKYLGFIEAYQKKCIENAILLKNDVREDEANFMKIKSSLCEVFKEALSVTDENTKFKNIIEKIILSWSKNYELAKQNHNYNKEMIEKTKLDAKNELLKSLEDF